MPGKIDRRRMPRHVAIIMDGNGRWAASRGLPRTEGHRVGIGERVPEVVDAALECGLPYLTLYAFSTENWRRSPEEVRFLMNFNREWLLRTRDDFLARGVRVLFVGRRDDRRLPRRLVALAGETEEMTAHCGKLHLTICLNYGGRAEIVDAVRNIAASGKDASRVTERDIAGNLYAPHVPDPDLVVRTSGEMRTSNFLVWQAAYAEWVFTPVLWPDFEPRHLFEAIVEYQRRSRRFGGA